MEKTALSHCALRFIGNETLATCLMSPQLAYTRLSTQFWRLIFLFVWLWFNTLYCYIAMSLSYLYGNSMKHISRNNDILISRIFLCVRWTVNDNNYPRLTQHSWHQAFLSNYPKRYKINRSNKFCLGNKNNCEIN